MPVSGMPHLVERLQPANQPLGYTPQLHACPATAPSVRKASSLSSDETSWLETRRPVALAAMQEFLQRVNISGFDVATYFSNHSGNTTALPNIAIAASGGGYRALMNGAGALAAFDSRTSGATSAGQLGGILQSATYLAGLSGGSWLTGSIFANNFTSVQDIINGVTPVWDFSNSILEGPNHGIQVITTAEYYDDLYHEVEGKKDQGFNITLTDIWGRALSFQLVNANDGGPNYTYSSLQNQTFFTNGSVPMPIIISDSRQPGAIAIASNTTVFEFNPFEFGSFDPTVYGWVPMQYIGTSFSNGAVNNSAVCVTGLDNIGYVYGTSSTLFNQIVLQFNTTVDLPSIFEKLIQSALNEFGERDDDISDLVNPFYGYNAPANPYAGSVELTLVDGGEDNQNIPLVPLIQPLRKVDAIFAIDSSADTDTHWPNGASLVATYQRSLNTTMQNNTGFPSIPDNNTFVNLGLNSRPTFFGCYNNTDSPLIIYLPNAPYSTLSNVSTYDLSYAATQRNAIITNGYNVATRANGTDDALWPVCAACAMLYKSFNRTGVAVPADCTTCFTNYCWNGTTNATTPGSYEPSILLGTGSSTASGASTSGSVGFGTILVILMAFFLL